MLQKIQKQWFTLVELIVVITILAILGTIAFISLQGYSKTARDSARISDMSRIKTSLELFSLEVWKYPETTGWYAVTYSWVLAWTQWTFWEQTFRNVERLDKIPLDPLTEIEYTYSVTNTRKEYELAGILETQDLAQTPPNLPLSGEGLTPQANAWDTNVKVRITWNYNGSMLKVVDWQELNILAVPSIICSEDLSLEKCVIQNKLAYDGYSNLPSNYSETQFNHLWEAWSLNLVNNADLLVFKWKVSELSEDTSEWKTARKALVENLKKAYSDTKIASREWIRKLVNIDTTDNIAVENLWISVVNNKINKSTLTTSWISVGNETTWWPEPVLCDQYFHDEAWVCISDTKEVQCEETETPWYSTSVLGQVTINYVSWAWEYAADCSYECTDWYTWVNCDVAPSCSEILANDSTATDWVYTIDPESNWTGFEVYCDMTTDWGGWTLVATMPKNQRWKASVSDYSSTPVLTPNDPTASFMYQWSLAVFNEAREWIDCDSSWCKNVYWKGLTTVELNKIRYSWGYTDRVTQFTQYGDLPNCSKDYVWTQNYNSCTPYTWVTNNTIIWWQVDVNASWHCWVARWTYWNSLWSSCWDEPTSDRWALLWMRNTDFTNLSAKATCMEHLNAWRTTDWTYTIDPESNWTGFEVYCDMTTDWGGWTRYVEIKGNYALADSVSCINGEWNIDNENLFCTNPYDLWNNTELLYIDKTTNNKYLTVIDAEYVDWYSEYTDKFWERTYFSIFIVNGSWAEVSWLWLNYDHTHSVCSWERHPWGRHWTAWYMNYERWWESSCWPVSWNRESNVIAWEFYVR